MYSWIRPVRYRMDRRGSEFAAFERALRALRDEITSAGYGETTPHGVMAAQPTARSCASSTCCAGRKKNGLTGPASRDASAGP
ncbi:hypothetical protein [Streptomyces noursei]|uniref:hypothetical protein n=1 Tax=Streptomyces noursei TaxID=1971 RepID=UPI00199B8E9F|nr:hypothetical protein [Streptomyces noursei]MCZ1021239.1 hypothetical protein [Streptomyces noursei]GGX53163.1 hypothetical protein GCM10010341_88080 [Streptomyces noursei]